jgi:hypothetical protein
MGRNSRPGDRQYVASGRVNRKGRLRLVSNEGETTSPFDDLDALRQALPPVMTRRERSTETFARIPASPGLRAGPPEAKRVGARVPVARSHTCTPFLSPFSSCLSLLE